MFKHNLKRIIHSRSHTIWWISFVFSLVAGSVLHGQAKLYWSDWGSQKIQSSNLDGTNITDLATGLHSLKGDVALDLQNNKVYWIDRGTGFLQKANLDGSNIQTIASGIGSGGRGLDLDVSNGHVYYGDYSNNNIKRANLDGSGVITVLSGLGGNRGHALDLTNGKIYWTENNSNMVRRANLNGSSIEDLITTGLSYPYGIILDVVGGKMYFSDLDNNSIYTSNLDGSNKTTLISGLSQPLNLELDLANGHIYWADEATSKIERCNLDGTGRTVAVTGLNMPIGLAIELPKPSITSELVAHFPFDGNSSDISGNNLNGTNTSVQWGGTLAGRSGQSLSLPGTDNKKVVVSHNNLLNLTEWTVSAWVYANNPDSGGVIIEKGDSPGANFRLAFNHSGGSPARQPYAFFEQSDGTDVKIAATGTNLQNQWASIVATRDSSSFRLYIDGTEAASQPSPPASAQNGQNLFIGTDAGSNYFFDGKIDDVRIYSRALSANEISLLYDLEKAKTPITNSNFISAINLWFTDEANATSTYGHISDWNVSAVTDMSNAFRDRTNFNEDITGWDVSKVTNMNHMFSNASSFNQPVGDWNVSSVTNMDWMFAGSSFNQPVRNWDVSSVTNLAGMFADTPFNQPIADWNTSSATKSYRMFRGATNFNQTVGSWDVSSITEMQEMFKYSSFNQPIGDWNVSSVTNFEGMFANTPFNKPIAKWDVSSVTKMDWMFAGATSFNQPIGDWNVTSVTNMTNMFTNASALSDTNKGLIHQVFSDQSGWPYNWSTFVPNQAPSNLFLSQSQFVENLAVGSTIGTFSAFDPDTNDTLSYWLMGYSHPTNQLFSLQSTNGVLRTASNFDFENNASSFQLSVKATDSSGSSTEGNFTITLTNDPSDDPFIPQALTDSNFQTAVNLWFSNQADANATYGHISDWNTSAVTNMSEAFKDRTTFNEDISGWDTSSVTKMDGMFQNATSFNQDIGDWNTSSVTSMREMFRSASAFNQPIGEWDVSSINNFQMTFERAIMFNQNIGDWDVSNVSTIDRMFQNASSFNQPIGEWNTSSVTNMSALFKSASSFNQPLSNWNVSSVTTMWHMFYNAITFDQDLSDWNISNVTNTVAMFFRSLSKPNRGLIHEAFSSNPNWLYDWREFVSLDDSNFQTAVNLWFSNQAEANATYGHISDWNTSAVTDMSEVFKDRANFNEDIGEWDVSKVTNMVRIFYEASSFNQDISNWDISSVMTLNGAFRGADSFNQDIGNWNTSLVTDISYLFAGADSFNQNIGNWDISNVRSMKGTFRFTDSFNQDLTTWDTSSVTNMAHAFELAQAFNQDLSDWNTSSVTDMTDVFKNSSVLSDTNKGLIHKSFSSNPNWPYDWSEFVEDSPTGSNPTFPISDYNNTKAFPEHWGSPPPNQTRDLVPFPGGYGMGSGTVAKWIQENLDRDKKNNAGEPKNPEIDKNSTNPTLPVQIYVPIVQTSAEKDYLDGTYTLGGKVLYNGGAKIIETGILISENILLKNALRIPSKPDAQKNEFSISFSDFKADKTYYYKSYAINKVGENRGSVKKFRTPSLSAPDSWYKNAESLPGGWKRLDWFGLFQPTAYQWIYHAELGWLYPSPMKDGSLWLWNQQDGWRWTQNEVFPYLFRWRDTSWVYFRGKTNGRTVFYNFTTKLNE